MSCLKLVSYNLIYVPYYEESNIEVRGDLCDYINVVRICRGSLGKNSIPTCASCAGPY